MPEFEDAREMSAAPQAVWSLVSDLGEPGQRAFHDVAGAR
jgi:hypothetical protein